VTPPPIDDSEAGFTIIEVLIALALVVVSLVAIGSLMATNARGVRSLEQHVALLQTARTVMTAAIPLRAELRPGAVSGQTDDYRWTIDVSALGGGWTMPDADVPWFPNSSGSASDRPLVRYLIFAPFG
jgi:general secretion pathway protein I